MKALQGRRKHSEKEEAILHASIAREIFAKPRPQRRDLMSSTRAAMAAKLTLSMSVYYSEHGQLA